MLPMLYQSITFLVLALVLGILGVIASPSGTAGLARALSVVFLLLTAVALIADPGMAG